MIQSKLIKNYKNISHGFFNKQGGYSKGIYKSLNCGIGSKDKKIHVKKNLNKVCKKIGCSTKNLVLLKQIHSNKVYVINKKPIKKELLLVFYPQTALQFLSLTRKTILLAQFMLVGKAYIKK